MVLQPDEIGQLVDTFLADHGGIHVRQKKLLAPRGDRLHHDIDRQVAARRAQPVGDGADIVLAPGRDIKGDVGCHFVPKPVRGSGRRQHRARAVQDGRIERGVIRIADQRSDERHGVTSGMTSSKAVLIAGATASGKSALALELAQKANGVVINTDSMQVYRDLRILTARPTPEEEARVPHRLYGHVDAAINYSAGSYVTDAASVLADARAAGRLPIFIGGSGLYFKALTRGLSAVPPIPDHIRDSVRARLEQHGVEALHAELGKRDPASAERLKPRDRTRIARALEVIEATGRSLIDWHSEGLPPLLPPGEFEALFLAPERGELYARIDARFATMLSAGALDEVARLAARRLDPLLPAMKAHGVPALIRYLTGNFTREEPPEIGRADTRHYAKRQFTWFRHQLPEFEWVKPEEARGWVGLPEPGWSAAQSGATGRAFPGFRCAASGLQDRLGPLHGREQQIRTRR